MQWSIPKLLAIGVTTLALPAAAHVAFPSFVADSDCESVARAQRNAAEAQAEADLWLAAAAAKNAPDSEAKDREKAARAAFDEAMALARDQFQARDQVCELLGGGKYLPSLSPDEFSTTIDNSFFPHVPGQTMVYEGDSADGFVHNEVTTTFDVVTIGGFSVRTIEDVVLLDGVLHEHATDYMAQRSNGDVWYFGEISRDYVDGFLDSLEGSWRTGKEEAKPGILMLKDNHVGDAYRQEYLIDVAEDVAMVLSTDETVTVPYGTFQHCLKTIEFAALEPDAFEWKFYAPGVGLVLIQDVVTGERLELVGIQ
jgi:hypothetical protein